MHIAPIGPELDLHSFLPEDATSVVASYVEAAYDAGLRDLRIVHGRGKGIQRALVQAALDKHPLVEAFDDDRASQLGATLIRLVP